MTTPNPGTAPRILRGVSCSATNACTAVGWKSTSGGAHETLVLRWNGTSWSTQTSANPGTFSNWLEGVSCTSSTSCVAVGVQHSFEEASKNLVLSWNGTTWTTQTAPNPSGSLGTEARAISCVSTSACEAVGEYQNSNGPAPFAIRWNGTSWSNQSVKLPSETNFGWLDGVSCTSSSFCMAAGTYDKIGVGDFTMTQKWNGTSWTAEKPPNPSAETNSLDAISCVATNWCKAAGYYGTGEANIAPLIEHFSG